jgi:glutamate-ammonia-ligase adenylyltransferase
VAGSERVAAHFNRVRQEVLCQPRDERTLARELLEMRWRMQREHGAEGGEGPADQGMEQGIGAPGQSPKHQPGGLIDIEFLAQLGVLTTARVYPRVIRATGTLAQLQELESIGWLSAEEEAVLSETMRRLRSSRMLSVLLPGEAASPTDTAAAGRIFRERIGDPGLLEQSTVQ